MSIILKNSVIMHLPKCGGNYVRKVLDLNNIPYQRTGLQPAIGRQRLFSRELSRHNIPHGLSEFENKEHKLVFVREPLEWYRSYWCERVKHTPAEDGKIPHSYWRAEDTGDYGFCEVDNNTHSDNFEEWIDNVINFYPYGPYSEYCKYYLSMATDVGLQENLASDLGKFLYEKEGVTLENLPDFRPNKSKESIKDMAQFSESSKKKLMLLESYMYENFYPQYMD